ncbi:MAG TPA: ABC transporter ATP-binding protein [Candidatus Ozemobacteraceae bacterium]|nr:ABC transporter ATP-binding protein [Candidatus Ozemobacteraceae bacterium]HQG29549.1 ABC transporter ATP-binding protein [Candidatus Ozemobacteraceae bacterium]
MNQNEPAISLTGIGKHYGDFEALKPTSLDIMPGEFFGFLGPNGAGKTTMIRIITGIIIPTCGSVRISGHDVAKDPDAAKRRIGYIPDRPYLYEKLTPLEYFEFVAGLYTLTDDLWKQRSEELLKLFKLWEWRNELIESFSHGMKQKVAMCSAFLHDPDIIIVDEPMVGLDPKSVRLVKDIFKEQVKKGKTIFLTTHTLSVAQDLCSRIGIINRGSVIALGTLEALRIQSGSDTSDLESVFLKLTEEEAEEAMSHHPTPA